MARRLEGKERGKFIFIKACLPILKSDLCRTIFVHIYLIYVKMLQKFPFERLLFPSFYLLARERNVA
jgi:hypothetical protein